MRALLAIVLAVGCGDNGEPPIGGDTHAYVVSRYHVPVNYGQARTLALDLGNSEAVDNQLGAAIAAFVSQAGGFFAPQLATDRLVARGEVLQLVEVQVPAPGEIGSFALHVGASSDPAPCAGEDDATCGRHLQGDAVFALAATSPVLPSRPDESVFFTDRGSLPLVLGIFGVPIQVDLHRARVRYQGAGDSSLSGVIAGGVPIEQVQQRLLPMLPAIMNAAVARDCRQPNGSGHCACKPSSAGGDFIAVFDTHFLDCEISFDEVRSAPLIQSMIAPDLETNRDPLLSLGIGFEAVRAQILR